MGVCARQLWRRFGIGEARVLQAATNVAYASPRLLEQDGNDRRGGRRIVLVVISAAPTRAVGEPY
eukprot:3486297-Lingulodinium_polyedra.AAC.1